LSEIDTSTLAEMTPKLGGTVSRRTDEEFEAIIHDEIEPEHTPSEESDEARHLREELEPAHAVSEVDAS
jgi:hypothetical protein